MERSNQDTRQIVEFPKNKPPLFLLPFFPIKFITRRRRVGVNWNVQGSELVRSKVRWWVDEMETGDWRLETWRYGDGWGRSCKGTVPTVGTVQYWWCG